MLFMVGVEQINTCIWGSVVCGMFPTDLSTLSSEVKYGCLLQFFSWQCIYVHSALSVHLLTCVTLDVITMIISIESLHF